MLLDFYLLGSAFFTRLQVALAESWRRRSFSPCRDLCAQVIARRDRTVPQDCLLALLVRGLAFARAVWQGVAAELIGLACEEIALPEPAAATLSCPPAPDRDPAVPA